MSAQLPASVSISRGNVCLALNNISVDPNAKTLVVNLQNAISADGPNYPNLTAIFDQHALGLPGSAPLRERRPSPI
jgi:hypothetical protein